MAGNGALDLSIRIMGKVDPSLVTAIKQTKGLTGDLANALTGTKSLGSTVANTLGVIGKTGRRSPHRWDSPVRAMSKSFWITSKPEKKATCTIRPG